MRPSSFVLPLPSPAAVQTSDMLLDAEQLGRFFNLGTAKPGSARAAINMRIGRGHPMPPSVMLPGMSGRRWLLSSVITWLKAYEKSDIRATVGTGLPATTPAPTVLVPRRRRGRPTKAETIARRAAAQAAFDSPPRFERR